MSLGCLSWVFVQVVVFVAMFVRGWRRVSPTVRQHQRLSTSPLLDGVVEHKDAIEIPISAWKERASLYRSSMQAILYPPGNSIKNRQHASNTHPIYNFLHKYYRYNTEDMLKYSPGMDVVLEYGSDDALSTKYLNVDEKTNRCYFDKALLQEKLVDGWAGSVNVLHNYEVLKSTMKKTPFFGCFGLHEWAMLYSGASTEDHDDKPKKHQEKLPLRVPQDIVNQIVETGPLRCTHFDAWRFFHPEAQPLNIHHPMKRQTQAQHEQGGCIHANMDLFKYAYQLHPLVSSDLVLRSLRLAVRARKIDMRASPYDVSQYLDSTTEGPIRVETKDGRMQYVKEQEALYQAAMPIRAELVQVYARALSLS